MEKGLDIENLIRKTHTAPGHFVYQYDSKGVAEKNPPANWRQTIEWLSRKAFPFAWTSQDAKAPSPAVGSPAPVGVCGAVFRAGHCAR